MPNYLPFAERRASTEYRDMLRAIRDGGVRVGSKQGEDALALAGCAMRFPMAHGAAVITERSIKGFVTKAIGELCAFINGATTLEELHAVVRGGEVLPQKSTHFYPKLLDGLVFHRLAD